MNRRAIRRVERLARRYEHNRAIPLLNEVEAALWRAGEVADRRLGGYWPWGPFPLLPSGIEHWTSQRLGWSFPCAEAVALIRRLIQWPYGRVIDIGAGCGLWTKVLKRVFGSDRVVGLDPIPKSDEVIQATFSDWCDKTGGPHHTDTLFASWLPCHGQDGFDLGPQILDNIIGEDQAFIYVGSGPNGPVGTLDFYALLAAEFEEYATEPLPRIYPSVFPRDFIRAYRRKPSLPSDPTPLTESTVKMRSVSPECLPPGNSQTA